MELYRLALREGKKQKYMLLYWPKCLEDKFVPRRQVCATHTLRIRHVWFGKFDFKWKLCIVKKLAGFNFHQLLFDFNSNEILK